MKFSNPPLLWQMDDLYFSLEAVSCCFTPWFVGLRYLFWVLKSHKSRRMAVPGQTKCLVSPICYFQQCPTWVILLDIPCCTATKHVQRAPLMWQRMARRVMLETSCTAHDEEQSLPSSPSCSLLPSSFQVKAALWPWACLFLQEDSAHWVLAPKSFFFLSSVLWAALLDSPMGVLLHDIQLICPQTMPWKQVGRFIFCLLFFFTFASHRPRSEEALKPRCASMYLLLVPWLAGDFSWKTQQQASDVYRVPRLIMFLAVKRQP